MNQNVAADDCIDFAGRLPFLNIGLHTLDVLDSFCGRPSFEGFKGDVVKVQGSDRTIRTDKPRREDGDVTNTATNIDKVHAEGDSGTAEELFCKRIQQRRLKYETTAFA